MAANNNEVEQHIVSPNMNIYCLMIQKHTSPIGLTNDFSALLLCPNSPLQKQSPLVESESKQTLWFCQISTEEKPAGLLALPLLHLLEQLLSVYTAKILQLLHNNRSW